MAQHIIVKHEDLHPELKEHVRTIRSFRKGRLALTLLALPGAGASSAFVKPETFALAPIHEGMSSGYLVKHPIAAGIGAIALGTVGYQFGSSLVRSATEELANKMRKAKTIDAKGTQKIAELRKTHPFAFVNRRGDIVLVPRTKFQEALAASQKTFLNYITPGRQRIRFYHHLKLVGEDVVKH